MEEQEQQISSTTISRTHTRTHAHTHVHTCTHITSEQGDSVEDALQLSHENVHEAVFGQMPRFFGILVIDHNFLFPDYLHLFRGKQGEENSLFVMCNNKKVAISKCGIWNY